jgi:thiol:disulfide interchange protein
MGIAESRQCGRPGAETSPPKYNMCMRASFKWRLAVTLNALAATAVFVWAEQPLYDEHADARADIRAALARASKEHKYVILDFGANWCLDCHVLEEAMRRPELAPVIAKSFIVVHIDVGRFDKNVDLADEYHVPLKKGVPALAVLDGRGKLLEAQEQGEFEDARHLGFDAIRAFFEKWKPSPKRLSR